MKDFCVIGSGISGSTIANLLNKKYFWNSEFYVNKNTLIPRPDTEIILEQILKFTKNKNYLNILDIGVGSGCIRLSVLKERKNKFKVLHQSVVLSLMTFLFLVSDYF